MSFHTQILNFIDQASTNNLKTKGYSNKFKDLKVKVSFGQGAPANIPWISFLKPEFTTANGIYPVYLYYKKEGLLILAYGISETNPPQQKWNGSGLVSINKYFENEGLEKPYRYGESYVFRIYDVKSLPKKEEVDHDLEEIINEYKSLEEVKTKISSENFGSKAFQKEAKICGLAFSSNLVERFSASLLTKPFLILTGLSGSGKTKLAQAFSIWLCEDKTQYKIVPVGADWTNRDPLLGYPNSLEFSNYVKPDNSVLDLLLEASQEENQNKPHFLILDEMNLSHVERYFADFLSVMESGDAIKLYSGTLRQSSDGNDIPQEITWPKNLFIIGTVNIDETTYMFSPKVLDRANVIEFRITEGELSSYLSSARELNLTALASKGSGMGVDFVKLAMNKNYPLENADKLNDALLEFFNELKKTGAEFGYRTASEIMRYVGIATKLDPEWGIDQIIDSAIMQKLLPKLHGSRSKLISVLTTLAKLCIEDAAKVDIKKDLFDAYDTKEFGSGLTIKYPISLEKICRMYKNVIANGFTSYAEA